MSIKILSSQLDAIQVVTGGKKVGGLKITNQKGVDSSLVNLPIISSAVKSKNIDILEVSCVFFYPSNYQNVTLSDVNYGSWDVNCLHLQINISHDGKDKQPNQNLKGYSLRFRIQLEKEPCDFTKVKIVFNKAGDPEGERGTETTVQEDDD
jgi:hypothetical protein